MPADRTPVRRFNYEPDFKLDVIRKWNALVSINPNASKSAFAQGHMITPKMLCGWLPKESTYKRLIKEPSNDDLMLG